MATYNTSLSKQVHAPLTSLDKILATFAALLLFGCYMFTFDGTLHSTDGLAMLAVAENLIKHGNFDARQLENWETTYLSIVGLNLASFDGTPNTPDELAILAAAETLVKQTRL